MRMKIFCRLGEGVTVTVDRPNGGSRAEEFLLGSIFTPTTLLDELLSWLDAGKNWADIASDAARDDAASALRALATQIEATKTALPEKDRLTNHPETAAGLSCNYSPYYGTSQIAG